MGEPLFRQLCAGLDQSVGLGHLPNPTAPPPRDGTRNDTDSNSYVWALRSRLIELGYLGDSSDNRGAVGSDSTFKLALRRFQRDVGGDTLKQDGWGGPKTWRIMQSLVSFEDDQEPRHWVLKVPLEQSPAVARAAYLRLWVMGFFGSDGWKADKLRRGVDATLHNPAFRQAYARFWTFAEGLGLLPPQAPAVPRLDAQCLGVLFNHDGIVFALADAGPAVFAGFAEQIEAVARIELWMLGYDCVPGPPRMLKRRRPGPRPRWQSIPRLHLVIDAFWDDFADRREGAPRDSVSPSLFAAMRGLLQEQEPQAADSAQLVRRVNEVVGDASTREDFLTTLGNLASSIWDGVKRMARFISRLLRGLISGVSSLLRNLARYVAREARQFFHLAVRALDVVQGGVDYLRGSYYPRQLPAPLVIGYGADFDHYLLVSGPAGAVTADPGYVAYRHLAHCYQAGCVVLGELIGLLAGVVRLATGALAGPLGWLRAMLALGRFRESVQRVKDALQWLEAQYEVEGQAPRAAMRVDVA